MSAPAISPGKQYSLILHVGLLILMIFGLPDFFHRKLDVEPEAISVDILPIAPMSNVKPQEKSEPKPEKKPVEKKTERKPVPETHKREEKPQEVPEKIKAKDVVKVPEKKSEKKPKPKPKPKVDELDSVLKSVAQMDKAEESKHPTEAKTEPNKHEARSETYDSSQPLSMSDKDAIRQQVEKFWNVPAGAKDAQNLIVTLHITLAEDGTVTSVELANDQSRYNSDSFFRAAVDSAKRAVWECHQFKNLPPDKYGTWRDMDFDFDPKDVM